MIYFRGNVYSTFYRAVPAILCPKSRTDNGPMKYFHANLFSFYFRKSLCPLLCLFLARDVYPAEEIGERLFLENCAECHQKDGKGIPNIYPALVGNELVEGSGADVALVLIIGRGEMPSFDGAISTEEMAHIVNYVRNAFGNQGELISAQTINSLK